MRTILVLMLMILLPLQASWSAAAVFCQHETRTGWHWGHHHHETDCQQNDNPSSAQELKAKYQNTTDKNIKTPADQSDLVKQKIKLTIHADHLNTNHSALKHHSTAIPDLQVSWQLTFVALQQVLYQAPILEQPKPPLWTA